MHRSIVITGGTAGLGFEAARAIALGHYPGADQDNNEYLVVLASRTNKDNAADALNAQISAAGRSGRVVFHRLDLAHLDSVRQFASLWETSSKESYPPITALLLNAGLQFPGALTTTAAGLESTFSINHVGHSLLFHLLLPVLDTSAKTKARVVVTSSGRHDPAQFSGGLPDAVYTSAHDLAYPPAHMVDVSGHQRYASSKLANVLWTYALDRRLHDNKMNVAVNAFDPGLMPGTGLAREAPGFLQFLWTRVMPRILPLMRFLLSPNIHSTQESGENLARVAVGSANEGVEGKYFEMQRPIPSSVDSYDTAKQDDLWAWTVQYVARDAAEQARFQRLE